MIVGSRLKRFVVVIVTVALAALGASASGAAAAAPTVTVTPNTGLVDRQNVAVSGSNFTASTVLFTLECTPGAFDLSACDFSSLAPANTDASGAFSVNRSVRRLIAPSQSVVDCAAPAGCLLAVFDGVSLAATATISFDPNVPPVLPKLTARKTTKLRDHQLVNVSGSGFDAGSPIDISECLASDPFTCAIEGSHSTTATARGTLSFKAFAVERELQTFDANGPHTVDCAAAPNPCVLTAGGGITGGVPSTVPLQFDPSVPPVVSSITLDATVAIKDLQTLTITGSGFLPGATVAVDQCASSDGACGTFPVDVTAGFTGDFALTYAVRRALPVLGFSGLRRIDCGSRAGVCSMVAADGTPGVPALAPLGFDRLTAATPSAVIAVPNAHLQDNQRIDVSFTGFSSYQPITMFECTAKALASGDASYCDPNTLLTTTTSAGGAPPAVSFFARRALEVAGGLVDCGAQAGACILIAITDDNASSGSSSAGSSGSQSSNAITALSRHLTPRIASRMPASLSRGTLQPAARAASTGVASTTLTFDPPPPS